uniref:Uncharacterized protein n=1 Tax=Palpitomonas bilix TaxID=652834 RepID=A0A7S3CV83_9EUKA
MALQTFLEALQLRKEANQGRQRRRQSIQAVRTSDMEQRDAEEVRIPRKVYFPRARGLLESRVADAFFAMGITGRALESLREAHEAIHTSFGPGHGEHNDGDLIGDKAVGFVRRLVMRWRPSCSRSTSFEVVSHEDAFRSLVHARCSFRLSAILFRYVNMNEAKSYAFHEACVLSRLPESAELCCAYANASLFLDFHSKKEKRLAAALLDKAGKIQTAPSYGAEMSYQARCSPELKVLEARSMVSASQGDMGQAFKYIDAMTALASTSDDSDEFVALYSGCRASALIHEHHKAVEGYNQLQNLRGFYDVRQLTLDCLVSQALSFAWLGGEQSVLDLLDEVDQEVEETDAYFQEDRLLHARYLAVGCWISLVQSSTPSSQSAGFGSEFEDPASFRYIESILTDSKECFDLLHSISVPAYVGEIPTLDLLLDVLFHLWLRVRAAEKKSVTTDRRASMRRRETHLPVHSGGAGGQSSGAQLRNGVDDKGRGGDQEGVGVSRPSSTRVLEVFSGFVQLYKTLSVSLPVMERRTSFYTGLLHLMEKKVESGSSLLRTTVLRLGGSSVESRYVEGEASLALSLLAHLDVAQGSPLERLTSKSTTKAHSGARVVPSDFGSGSLVSGTVSDEGFYLSYAEYCSTRAGTTMLAGTASPSTNASPAEQPSVEEVIPRSKVVHREELIEEFRSDELAGSPRHGSKACNGALILGKEMKPAASPVLHSNRKPMRTAQKVGSLSPEQQDFLRGGAAHVLKEDGADDAEKISLALNGMGGKTLLGSTSLVDGSSISMMLGTERQIRQGDGV